MQFPLGSIAPQRTFDNYYFGIKQMDKKDVYMCMRHRKDNDLAAACLRALNLTMVAWEPINLTSLQECRFNVAAALWHFISFHSCCDVETLLPCCVFTGRMECESAGACDYRDSDAACYVHWTFMQFFFLNQKSHFLKN